ncbi:MAG: penicillin-binding transpeptidase domain-containing protein [Actinomycetota bacterium]|nr:penicillin-binding transpeptidase domain-containing protein [Actinomycetota bacterium]
MIRRPEDRVPAISPRLALRIAVLGFVALGLFALIFFRLWYLQVLTGDQYLAEARDNRVRELRIQAPRGEIVDRDNRTLVTNRQATVVSLDPSRLPEEVRDMAATWGQRAGQREARPEGERSDPVPLPRIPTAQLRERYEHIGRVLELDAEEVHARVIRSLAVVPYANVNLDIDSPRPVLNYLSERSTEFPGVEISERYLREYPREELAAQLFGVVGEISPEELEEERYRGVEQGAIIGKEGLERSYDRYLRGQDGIRRVVVDAMGRRNPDDVLPDTDPVAGRQLRLSIDLELQEAGQEALAQIGGGRPGGFVAMDPENGEVLAMGSFPSFDPNRLSGRPITQERYDELYGEEADSPRFNRVISGSYPIGSTFKPIVAIGMLQSGAVGPGRTINDPGFVTIGNQDFQNAGRQPYGTVGFVRSLEVSSDVYYYTLGQQAHSIESDPIQTWARRLGFDEPTGIDLPGEFGGTVPDEEWSEEIKQAERDCREEEDRENCGIALLDSEWTVGQTVQLAIGQGGFQASPMQLATAYAAIANGGDVVTPRVGLEVTDGAGVTVQSLETDPARELDISQQTLGIVRNGLRLAANGPGGTSTAIFDDFPGRYTVHGKTGTAQRPGQGDQSWYVAYVPDRERPIVVAATVEEGGFGAETAAPVVCRVMRAWYDVDSECSAAGAQVADD